MRINLGGYCADCRSIKFKLPDKLKPGQLIEIDCRLQSARIATTQRGSQFWRIRLRTACAKICLHTGNFENYRLRMLVVRTSKEGAARMIYCGYAWRMTARPRVRRPRAARNRKIRGKTMKNALLKNPYSATFDVKPAFPRVRQPASGRHKVGITGYRRVKFQQKITLS